MLIITAFSCWMVTYVLDSTSRLSLEKYSVDFVLLKWSAFSVNQILVVTVVVFSELEVKVVASVASSGVVSDVSMFLKSNQNRVKWINVSKLIWFFYIFIYLIFKGLVMIKERERERERESFYHNIVQFRRDQAMSRCELPFHLSRLQAYHWHTKIQKYYSLGLNLRR